MMEETDANPNASTTEATNDAATKTNPSETRESAEDPGSTSNSSTKPWGWLAVAAAAGLVIGAGVASVIVIPQLVGQQDALAAASKERDDLIVEKVVLKNEAEEWKSRSDRTIQGLNDREAELDDRAKKLDEREKATEEREKALKEKTTQVEANSFTNGVHVIGESVKPGEYKSTSSGACYYAWKTGTGSDADIVDNNFMRDGTAVVTLNSGDVFESNGCGQWARTQ